jgi:hypothetical protein
VLERLKPLSSLTAEQQIGGIIIDSFDGDCWRVLERIDELLEVPSILCTTSPNYIRRAEQKGYIAFLYKLGAACDMRSLLIAEFPIFVPLRAAAK